MRNILCLVAVALSLSCFAQGDLKWVEVPLSPDFKYDVSADVSKDVVYFAKVVDQETNTVEVYKQSSSALEPIGPKFRVGDEYTSRASLTVKLAGEDIYLFAKYDKKTPSGYSKGAAFYKYTTGKWDKLPAVSSNGKIVPQTIHSDGKTIYTVCEKHIEKQSFAGSVYKYEGGRWKVIGSPDFVPVRIIRPELHFDGTNPILSVSYNSSKKTNCYTYVFDGTKWKNINKGPVASFSGSGAYSVYSNGKRHIAAINARTEFKTYQYKTGKWLPFSQTTIESIPIYFLTPYIYKNFGMVLLQDKTEKGYMAVNMGNKWTKPKVISPKAGYMVSRVFDTPEAAYLFMRDKNNKEYMFKLAK